MGQVKKNLRLGLVASLFVLLCSVITLHIAKGQSTEPFYKGRTLSLVVGAPPGGGYDLYARMIGRMLGRKIPGQPTVAISYMPGAASAMAASFMANVAPRDGTVIGALYMGAVVEPLFGNQNQANYDISKFNFIGNANKDTYVCISRSDAPAKSFAETFGTELIVGASADGAGTRDFPNMLHNLLGAKLKVVAGYRGTRDINLAIENGEIHGGCGQTWSSLASNYPQWFEKSLVRVLVQEDSVGYPDLNKRGVPIVRDFAKSDEQRAVLDLVYSQTEFGRPYVLAPGVPLDRVDILRRAFLSVMHDDEFQAEARRIQLDTIYTPGEELQGKLSRLYSAPATTIALARRAINGAE